jgi:hypothetical protein
VHGERPASGVYLGGTLVLLAIAMPTLSGRRARTSVG